VMPRGFRGFHSHGAELWVPVALTEEQFAAGATNEWLASTARLAPGVTLERTAPEVLAFMARLGEAYPEQNAGLGATVESLYTATVGDVRTALWALLGAVAFVLLIACANIGNLLLTRASGRRAELAVRRALGANRRQLVRQLLTESFVLSLIGASAGVVLAFWLLELLRVAGPADLPRLQDISIDLRVLGAALLAALLAGAACGLAPAFTVARDDLHTALKEGGRVGGGGAGTRLRAGLVVSEIALALVLLVGAGLLLRSFSTLMHVDAGFDAEGVLTLQFGVPANLDPTERTAFYDRLFEDLHAIPGVQAAGGVTRLPLGSQLSTRLEIRGREFPDGEQPDVEFRRASGGYFAAMGIPVMSGRTFDARDRPDAPLVMIISRAAAEQFWPGEDPVGKYVRFWFAGITPDAPWIEIVGVTGDVRHFGLDVAPPPVVYVPFSQGPPGSPLLAVRTSGDPLSIAGAVRDRIRARDPSIVIWALETMTARVAGSVAGRRFNLMLVGLFGLIALVLAAVGIYGVIAHGVRRRTQEIGIRMALGATGGDVVRMVVRRGLQLTALGLAAGLLTAVAVTRLIRGLLFGVGPTDPITLVGTTLLLATVALLASWIPSRRAVRVNPVEALRHE
ncbi:MAG: ADOP family duplicated permease, partial [Gemmatimonadales bacterium]